MSNNDFVKRVGELLNKRPFQPFVIEFEDGDRFVVGEPEALWHHGDETAVYFRTDGSLDFVNSEAVRQIVELVPATTNNQ